LTSRFSIDIADWNFVPSSDGRALENPRGSMASDRSAIVRTQLPRRFAAAPLDR